MITFEQIQKANELIKPIEVKGNYYAEVAQRVKAFRSLYPEGTIETEMIFDDGNKCIFKATAKNGNWILGTGTAYELLDSNYINKTSYIENCETSAVGRALAMCGIGIDVSISSADEVQNAELNQVAKMKIDKVKVKALESACKDKGIEVDKILKLYKVKDLTDLTETQFSNINLNWEKIKNA